MAYTYPMTLNPLSYGGADTDLVLDSVDTGTAYRTVSTAAALALTTPTQMIISHDARTINGKTVYGHLARLSRTFSDDDGEHVLSAALVLKVPQLVTAVTNAQILDVVGNLVDFTQNSGNFTKFLNRES
jgi:hypothetical protein